MTNMRYALISLLRNVTRIDTDSPVRDMAVNGRRTGIR